jgi:pre-mRNA-splicing helicase BRR2
MLRDTVKLVQALVDVVASQAWLKPALAAMELGQMAVQGMWDKDSPLLQIPHFDADTVVRCQAAGAESVFDVLEMEDDVRETALQLSAAQMSDVALFCNAYPNIECSYETDLRAGNSAPAGSTVTLSVALQRDLDEEDEEEVAAAGKVVSSRFPGEKTESWWLVLGDKATNALLCIKRVSLSVAGRYKLQFTAPEVEGSHALTLYLMSDSYLGCDQEYSLDVTVTQAEMEESSSEDEN